MKFEKFNPPVIAQILIIIFGIIGYFFGRFISYPFNLFGILFMIVGFWIMMNAYNIFTKHKTGVAPTSKTTRFIIEGPYKFSRNPMYLGMFLILLGIGVLIGSWISIIASVLFVIIINLIWIPFEEKKLGKQFGKEYFNYKKEVRRWI